MDAVDIPAGLSAFEWAFAAVTLGVALLFKPWQVWQRRALQNPWLFAMAVLPWSWWTKTLLPAAMPIHLSGACLLVLMFGWPMAVVSLWPVSILASAADLMLARHKGLEPPHSFLELLSSLVDRADAIVSQTIWMGVLPATIALVIGLAVRRWLPQHLFVYILGRAFIATVLSVSLSTILALLLGFVPAHLSDSDWLLSHWLLGWGEGIATGMLTSIFVAFKPEWLLTYTDERYLPKGPRPGQG